MENLETGILLELWPCIMEQIHKTSQALQDSKMTLKMVANLLQVLHDFVQLLRSQFQYFEERDRLLNGLHHHTEDTSRQKRRKVSLDSESGSENTSLDARKHIQSRITFTSVPVIDQILLSMKIRIAAYNSLQSRFLFLMELNITSNRVIKEIAKL